MGNPFLIESDLWLRGIKNFCPIPEFKTTAERLRYLGVECHEVKTVHGTILLVVDPAMPPNQVRFV